MRFLFSRSSLIGLISVVIGAAVLGIPMLISSDSSEGAGLRQMPSDQDRVVYQRTRIIQSGEYPKWVRTPTGVEIEQFPEVIMESWTRIDRNNLVIQGRDVLSTPDGRVYQEGIMDRTGKLTTRTIYDGETSAFSAKDLGQIQANPDSRRRGELNRFANDPTWTKLNDDGATVTFRQLSPVTVVDPYGYAATVVLSKSTGSILKSRTEYNAPGGVFQETINEAYEIYAVASVDPKVWVPIIK